MSGGSTLSENESLKGEMSYLYGRDPSILAYGQRPFPSQESKRNLMSLLEDTREENESAESREKTSTSVDSLPVQKVKVFLRLKPFPHKMKLTPEQLEAYKIINTNTLLTKIPSFDNNTSYLKKIKNSDTVYRNFFFTRTFDSNTSQLQLFEEAIKPQMIEFLDGKSSIIMSYGTTNSGKTYTLQGTADSPGIIPRAIEFVFSNIFPRRMPYYKPVNLCDVVNLSTHDRLHELELKTQLLAFNTTEEHYHINTFTHMQQLLHKESPIRLSCKSDPHYKSDAHYSVWISFAEIYNETIYDLLSNDCQKKRPALKLAIDGKGRAFIKGLKSICVNSGVEAYRVLMAGQYNLKVAATALNSRSSRSHCIFTIKLLKYKMEQDPQSVVVSTFAFCDLAGSERLKKTLNVGDRLKEAQNINTSLLVLGRCLKTIYEAQSCSKQKIDSIGPFRESKLTRLFQRALSGKEQIALIVNVNPVPNLYVETQNVLNFSAIAKKIIIKRTEMVNHIRRSQTRFSRLVTQNMKTDMDWENTELDEITEASEDCNTQDSDLEENDQEVLEELINENELLKNEIKELKSAALKRDMQTRQEMANMYSDMIKDLEAHWKNRLIDLEEQEQDLRELAIEHIEQFYKEKLKKSNTRKRSRSTMDEEDQDDEEKLIEDLEHENTRLLTKIEILKKSVSDLKHTKETIESERSKISFELAVTKDEAKRVSEMLMAAQKSIYSGEDTGANFIKELQDLIKTKDERIRTMKVFLNEAKEEYISITNDAQRLENEIKKKDEILIEKNEQIQDLEEQVSQANIYSSEQNRLIEKLEEDIDQQTNKLVETEKEVCSLTKELTSLTLSKNNPVSEIQNEGVNNDNEYLNLNYKDIKIKLELLERQSCQIKQTLAQKISQIKSLEENLDSTKNKLHEITGKMNSLDINDSSANIIEQKKNKLTSEQASQTETGESAEKKSTESISNISSQISKTEVANISCQTSEIEYPITDTQSNDKILMDQILAQGQEKDKEISSLQTEIKNLLQSNDETVRKMEIEMKNLLKELTTTKDQLLISEEKTKKLEKDYRQVIHILEVKIGSLEKQVADKQPEKDKLLLKIEELTKNLDATQYDLEVFKRNRDETVFKYENLVKSQNEDLEQKRKEITRLKNTISDIKENQEQSNHKFCKKKMANSLREEKRKEKMILGVTENMSDENCYNENKTENFKKQFRTPRNNANSVIELSDSESNSTKEPAPNSRKTRRKKLFTPLNESYVDVEQIGGCSPSPSSCTRSLRNRRK